MRQGVPDKGHLDLERVLFIVSCGAIDDLTCAFGDDEGGQLFVDFQVPKGREPASRAVHTGLRDTPAMHCAEKDDRLNALVAKRGIDSCRGISRVCPSCMRHEATEYGALPMSCRAGASLCVGEVALCSLTTRCRIARVEHSGDDRIADGHGSILFSQRACSGCPWSRRESAAVDIGGIALRGLWLGSDESGHA